MKSLHSTTEELIHTNADYYMEMKTDFYLFPTKS